MSVSTRSTGNHAEAIALAYLRKAGLTLVQQNFTCKTGEIDLVMTQHSKLHGTVLVFVEVRYRKTGDYGGAAASVTPDKRLRIVRTAKRFLQTHGKYHNLYSRFDVVAISGDLDTPSINWLVSAFDC